MRLLRNVARHLGYFNSWSCFELTGTQQTRHLYIPVYMHVKKAHCSLALNGGIV